MDPLFVVASVLARDRTEHHALSARPHAPVLPDPGPPPVRFARSRTAVARGLLRLARAVEPVPRRRTAP